MDELDISGKRYISTRRAGKEHGYHSDYIGQLIRGGKVKGQKFGRAWYVDEESLTVYLGKEYTPPISASTDEKKSDVSIEEVEAEEIAVPTEIKESVQAVVESVAKPTEAAVERPAEIVIEIKKEEPLHTVTDTPSVAAATADTVEERKIPIHTPVREVEKHEQVHTGLVYITDDAPLLPNTSQTNAAAPELAETTVATKGISASKWSRAWKAPIVLVLAATLLVSAVSFASMYVTSIVQVAGDAPATIFYAVRS